MILETPAEGIMKTGDYGDSKFYKVVCGCGQSDHDVDFEVEADETGVNVNTYVTAKSDYWSQSVAKRYDIDNTWLQEWDWFWKDLANDVVRRVKLTWRIWTQGFVQTESTISMTEQQALNYAETIKLAIKDVKSFRRTQQSEETKQVMRVANEQDCI